MSRIKMGMLGGGGSSLIGIVHRIAAYMGERYEFVGGAFSSDMGDSMKLAKELDLDEDRVYVDIDEMIDKESRLPEDRRMEVVSIVTPNFLHHQMAKKLIVAGFHVICEKPMTMNLAEAVELRELVEKHQTLFALTHTYTGYPMVREMRSLISSGRLGNIQKVDAQYYQGWINPFMHDKEKRASVWRLDPEKGGMSCCIGDIGVHAFQMIEYVTGLQVQKVLSDLNTLYADNALDVDGSVLLRLEGDVRGMVRASQIATGEENNFRVAVYGEKAGLRWEQENPNYLYLLEGDKPLQVLKPGHGYNGILATHATKMPPGHPEGIFDAMGNIYAGMAKAIRGEKVMDGEYPTVEDGVRGMCFIEQSLASSKDGNVWKEMNI